MDVKGREERVHLVRLEVDSPEYKGIQERFMKSVMAQKVRITVNELNLVTLSIQPRLSV